MRKGRTNIIQPWVWGRPYAYPHTPDPAFHIPSILALRPAPPLPASLPLCFEEATSITDAPAPSPLLRRLKGGCESAPGEDSPTAAALVASVVVVCDPGSRRLLSSSARVRKVRNRVSSSA